MSASSSELKQFATQSSAISEKAKASAMALSANTVQVWPGGARFSTIQAAMDSITGASAQEQYQVAVGPGTYNENVVMKDYVYVIGSGQDVTIITAPPQQNAANGVVNSASGGGISELTINAPGAGWGSWPIGIKICGSGKFHVRGITNNAGSYAGSVIVGQSIINLTGDSQTTCVGMELFGSGGLTVMAELTAIQCTGGAQNFGISTAAGANVTADDSKIIANTYALYNSDGGSPITANQCTISGPVSSGVVVNN